MTLTPYRQVLTLALATLVAAAAAPAAAETLTLDRALELAERYSPRLQTALADVERARSGIRTARAYPNPQVDLSTGNVRALVPGVTAGRGTAAAIAQPIDLPNQRAPRIRAAEEGLKGSRFALDEARLLLLADVRQAFFDVLRRKAEFELFLDNQKLLEQIRDRIALRVKVGEGAKFELTRSEAEVQVAANQTQSARLRVTQALATLRVLVGAPLPADTDVTGEIPAYAPIAELDALRALMLERYPSLMQARADVRRLEARVEAERALRVPRPTLFAGVDRDPEMDRSIFGLSVPIPLWDRRAGPIGEAAAQFQQAVSVAELRRLQLNGDLEVNYNRLLVARQQIAAFEGGLLKQAENALAVAQNAYRYGERGFIDVLDAQRVLRSVRADFLTARFEKQSALIELDRLTAKDLPGDSR